MSLISSKTDLPLSRESHKLDLMAKSLADDVRLLSTKTGHHDEKIVELQEMVIQLNIIISDHEATIGELDRRAIIRTRDNESLGVRFSALSTDANMSRGLLLMADLVGLYRYYMVADTAKYIAILNSARNTSAASMDPIIMTCDEKTTIIPVAVELCRRGISALPVYNLYSPEDLVHHYFIDSKFYYVENMTLESLSCVINVQ